MQEMGKSPKERDRERERERIDRDGYYRERDGSRREGERDAAKDGSRDSIKVGDRERARERDRDRSKDRGKDRRADVREGRESRGISGAVGNAFKDRDRERERDREWWARGFSNRHDFSRGREGEREKDKRASKFYRYDSPPKDSSPGSALVVGVTAVGCPVGSGGGFSTPTPNSATPSSSFTSTPLSGFSGPPQRLSVGGATEVSDSGSSTCAPLATSLTSQQVNNSNSKLASIAAALGLDANAAKAARELYVGNLPPSVEVQQLVDFLNAAMIALKATIMPGNPVTKSWISTDGHYAFVEFRTMEEAANGMQLNGLMCMNHNLRIGRPKTYPPELAAIVPAPTVAALDGSYLNQGIAGVQSGVAAAAASFSSSASTSANGVSASPTASTLEEEGRSVAASPEEALRLAQAAAAAMHHDGTADTSTTGPQPVAYVPPEKVCIMGMPTCLTESKVRLDDERKIFLAVCADVCVNIQSDDVTSLTSIPSTARSLVETFGPVTQFQLLTCGKGRNAGVVICVFEDYATQKTAAEILHDNTSYKVLDADEAYLDGRLNELMSVQIRNASNPLLRWQIPTRVLLLSNLHPKSHIFQDAEYDEVRDDVKLECEEFGEVLSVTIPHRSPSSTVSHQIKGEAGVTGGTNGNNILCNGSSNTWGAGGGHGKDENEGSIHENDDSSYGYAFVEFNDIPAAARARSALSGRKFAGRVVQANYFSEFLYKAGRLNNPSPNFKRHHSSLHNSSLLPSNSGLLSHEEVRKLLQDEEESEMEARSKIECKRVDDARREHRAEAAAEDAANEATVTAADSENTGNHNSVGSDAFSSAIVGRV